jgi:hypothetical protein
VLERKLVDQITPEDRLDVDPYYRLLVDDIITEDHPDFALIAEDFAKNLVGAPSSFSGHEFHQFNFFAGASHCTYIIIVFENRCISVVPALIGGTFIDEKDKRALVWDSEP